MGQIRPHRPVLSILAAFSRHSAALDWAAAKAAASWGPIALSSERLAFDQTDYYQKTMGGDLRKQFLAFEPLMEPPELVPRKHLANAWEEQYRELGGHHETRPLNLDPGYLTEAKLVLATTKDRDHRLYLSDGIYAEGTLFFHAGGWQPRPWTYPDYRCEAYHRFFLQCRNYLKQRYRDVGGSTAQSV